MMYICFAIIDKSNDEKRAVDLLDSLVDVLVFGLLLGVWT